MNYQAPISNSSPNKKYQGRRTPEPVQFKDRLTLQEVMRRSSKGTPARRELALEFIAQVMLYNRKGALGFAQYLGFSQMDDLFEAEERTGRLRYQLKQERARAGAGVGPESEGKGSSGGSGEVSLQQRSFALILDM